MPRKIELSIRFAVPIIPVGDAADGADVRIAMTVGERGEHPGLLQRAVTESLDELGADGLDVQLADRTGKILSDLTIGPDLTRCVRLKANDGLSCPGVKLHGAGFIVTPEQAASLGLGHIEGLERHIRSYVNGRDLNQQSRNLMVIDLLGLTAEQVQGQFPEVYQWILAECVLTGYPVMIPCNSRYLNGTAGLLRSGFKSLSMR